MPVVPSHIYQPKDVETCFRETRSKAITMLRNTFNMSYSQAEDIYQDSCLAMYQNIKRGMLDIKKMTSSLSTYLITVCFRQASKSFRNVTHLEDISAPEFQESKIDSLLNDTYLKKESVELMWQIVHELPDPCGSILWYYYGKNLSMAEIAPKINFNGADSVKAKKSNCLSRLKKFYKDQLSTILHDNED